MSPQYQIWVIRSLETQTNTNHDQRFQKKCSPQPHRFSRQIIQQFHVNSLSFLVFLASSHASNYKLFGQFWKQGTEKISEKTITCQLCVGKTYRGISWQYYTLACLLTLSCSQLFYLFHSSSSWSMWPPAQPQTTQLWSWGLYSSEHHLSCWPVLEPGIFCLVEHFSPLSCFSRWKWEGQRGRNPLPPCKRSGSPPAPALSDSPCSRAHSASWAGVLTAHAGKAVTGKEPQIQQERSTLHFLPPRAISVCYTGVSLVCLPAHFCWETELVQGCGTRTLWPPARVPHRCVSWDPFTSTLAAEPAQAVCFPSVCFHWLELAFFQFLPFLACQFAPVNPNNNDASAFQPQLWKLILSPAEL